MCAHGVKKKSTMHELSFKLKKQSLKEMSLRTPDLKRKLDVFLHGILKRNGKSTTLDFKTSNSTLG